MTPARGPHYSPSLRGGVRSRGRRRSAMPRPAESLELLIVPVLAEKLAIETEKTQAWLPGASRRGDRESAA